MNFFKCKKYFSTITSPLKTGLLIPLESRGVICISGRNTYDLLQGICTNDIKNFTANPDQISLSTIFLNTQGRIVADGILVKPVILKDGKKQIKPDEIWLDCKRSQLELIQRHIKQYILRKKVSLMNISDQVKVWSLISPFAFPHPNEAGKEWKSTKNASTEEVEEGNYVDTAFIDPRLSKMGVRMVTAADEDPIMFDETEIDRSIPKYYDFLRMLFGVAEGEEIRDCLPFTANIDFLNSVSFTKGCYVGQELIARTFHTGIIRKRITPFLLNTPKIKPIDYEISNGSFELFDEGFDGVLKDKIIKNNKGQNIGKIVGNIHNVGLAITASLKIENDKEKFGYIDETPCSLLKVDWYQEKITNYIEGLKKRDADIDLSESGN